MQIIEDPVVLLFRKVAWYRRGTISHMIFPTMMSVYTSVYDRGEIC